MARRTSICKRLLCMLVTLSLLLAYLPGMTSAATSTPKPSYTITADSDTTQGWKNYFGSTVLNTNYAGAVWTDKSVFTQDTLPSGASIGISDPERNFLVALSAIAANKSIVGHSNVPTDTMLVLDISNSMITAGAVDELVNATNDAISRLLALNNNNRVGVILYSSSGYSEHDKTGDASTVLLPLDRYTTTNNIYLDHSSTSDWWETYHYITVNTNVKDSNRNTVNPDGDSNEIEGGTYIQSGLDTAMDQFLAVPAADTKIQSGFQAGKERMPVIVLMSDGAPTYATTNIGDVGDKNMGSGRNSTNINAFLTQLTAAYTKARVKAHYNDVDPLLYTLGLGVGSDSNATAVLDPHSSDSTITGWWNTYISSSANENGTVAIRRYTGRNEYRDYYIGKVSNLTAASQMLYSDGYFEADTASELEDAFDSIVQQIIIQSLYYPTLAANGEHNFGGYLSFVDDIGEYMEVIDIKGIQLGSYLFSGAELAKNFAANSNGGNLGTLENPTNLGDEFVRAVIERFGFEQEDSPYYGDHAAALAAAHDLIELAYTHGQLSYTDENNFSNYIGSYQDADGNFISFYNEGTTSIPTDSKGRQAAYKIKSYGMLGAVEYGMKKTDMMYVSIQVRTEILPDGSDGKTAVIWQIPAALIPVVSYNVTVEGAESMDDINANSEINVEIDEADPIRLIFEVGLRSDINELNVADIMKADGVNASTDSVFVNANGSYTFLSNRYDLEGFNTNASPSKDMNTVSYFEPSKENERFYYPTNTTILVKNGSNYTPYTGTTAPSVTGEYYREYDVFVYDTAASKWVYAPEHEIISAESLALAQKNGSTWYVPAGTVHRITATSPVEKADDTITNTLDYVMYPTVEKSGTLYYVDSILGNNGALTLVPATGLRLTKTVDGSLTGTTEEFTFNIVSGTLSGTFETIHTDVNGTAVQEGIDSVTFTNGAASVKLKAGESLLILAPAGSYQVTEVIVTGNHYTVSKVTVNGATLTGTVTATAAVTNLKITDVSFENTYQVNNGYGNLVISKAVTGVDPADPNLVNKVFTFDVTLTNSEQSVSNKTYTTSSGSITTNANGKFTVQLKAGESFSVVNLPAKTQVSVTEKNNPNGFTVSGTATKTTTIANQATSAVSFVNDYKAASITANITISGDKTLSGRDWLESDSFAFYLQVYDTAINGWKDVPNATATATKANKTYTIDFTDTYTTSGTYLYRVLERGSGTVVNGVHYSNVAGHFNVVVTDSLSGQLSAQVIAGNGTSSVTPGAQNNAFEVDVDFTNNYVPSGTASVTVNVQKKVTCSANTVHDLSGFTFGLFSADGITMIDSAQTDASGKVSFTLTYGANYVDQEMNYFVQEIVPADPIDGMEYDTNPVSITVKISDVETTGTLTAVVTSGQEPDNTDTDTTIEITNRHNANAASIELAGLKTLNGRDLNIGEFEFALYQTDSSFTVPAGATALQTTKNTAVMTRTANIYNYHFAPISFSTTDTYYYVVKEAAGSLGGVSYDTTEYHITVVVSDDNDDEDTSLETTVTIVKVTDTGSETIVNTNTTDTGFLGLNFVNSYAPSGAFPSVNVTVNKEITDLSGSNDTFSKEGYKFGLYLDAACTQAVTDDSGNPVTAITNANGIATITVPAISNASVKTGEIFNYYLKEESHSVAGMVANTQLYHVHVEVLDNLDGTFGAKTSIHADGHYTIVDTATFTNVYDPQDAAITLEGEKTLNGRDMAAGEFDFHLYQVDDTFTIPTGATALQTVKNAAAADGTASAFRFEELTFDQVGQYHYVVIEHHSGRTAHGVKHSDAVYNIVITVKNDAASGKLIATKTVNGSATAPISFVNTYTSTPAPNTVTILGEKILKDRVWLDSDRFEFRVERFGGTEWNDTTKANDTNWLQVGVNAAATKANSGKFDLSSCLPTEFPAAGTYYYRITEVGGGTTVNGVTYSSEKLYFAIVVEDNGHGALEITSVTGDHVTGDAANGFTVSASFTNTYAVSGTLNVPVTGNKVLENRDLLANEFQFDLLDKDGTVIESVKNAADGTFTFTKLNYTAPGTYVYTVVENQSVTADRVTNDQTKYQVTVTVTDVLDGTLAYTVSVKNLSDATDSSGKITFTNVYTPKPTDITVDLGVVKTVKNLGDKTIGKDGFQFDLKDGASEEILKTVTTDAEGLASITLTFSEEDIGKHTYKLVEKNTGVEGVTYSNAIYNIEITVALGTDNKLTASIVCNGQAVDSVSAAFENLYDVDEPAKTGDQMDLMLWLCLLVVTGGLTVAMIYPVVRKKEK